MTRVPCVLVCLFLCAARVAVALSPSYPSSLYPTGTARMFLVDDSVLSACDLVTLQTLGGGLARTTPQIYRLSSSNVSSVTDSYSVWLQEMVSKHSVETDSTFISDFPGLLKHYASSIRGYALFTNGTESVNAAITYCAGQSTSNSVPVAVCEPRTIALLDSLGVRMERNLSLATVSEVYTEFRGNFRHRQASFQPPSKCGNLAEYAVFGQMPTLEYIGEDGGDTANLVMTDIGFAGVNGVAMGWGPEQQYVSQLSSHGIYVHASDWSKDVAPLSNLHVHSSVKSRGLPQQPAHASAAATAVPSNAGTHTVTFLMTDGDNIQWLLNDFAISDNWFGSHLRPTVPVGWTITPALASVAPVVLEYVYEHASVNDSFVCGPSGVGYIYPDQFSDVASFANLTAEYMSAADQSIVNVIANTMNVADLLPYVEKDVVEAVFLYSYSDCYAHNGGQVQWLNGKPIIEGRIGLSGDGTSGPCQGIDSMVKQLATLSKDATSPDAYSLIPVQVWSHPYADVVQAVRQLEALGGFTVVTPADFVRLFKANVAPPPKGCPDATGSYSDSCGSCSVDANCNLTCTCASSSGAVQSTCSLHCCSYLTNQAGALFCDNRACPLMC